MRLGFAAMALGLAFALTPVSGRAQEPPALSMRDVVAHFRAFEAAYEGGDLETAEREARAALATHEAIASVTATRGVLATNLAIVLLDSRQAEPAQATLQMLRDLPPEAEVHEGVLTMLGWRAAVLTLPEENLAPALDALSDRPTDDPVVARQAFLLAGEIGEAALGLREPNLAQQAWQAYLDLVDYSTEPLVITRARGLVRLGNAYLLGDRDRLAVETLADALTLTAPYAGETANGPMTSGQALYAQVLAWYVAANTKRRSEGFNSAWEMEEYPPQLADLPPRCRIRFNASPLPDWPNVAESEGYVGSVVLRYSVSEAGEVLEIEPVAAVPHAAFAENVREVMNRWSIVIVRPQDDSPCRVARHGALQTVSFTFELP